MPTTYSENKLKAGSPSHHHSNVGISEKNLLAAVILNFTITAVEIAGGLMSNSLALLSDAIHNLGDGFAVLLA